MRWWGGEGGWGNLTPKNAKHPLLNINIVSSASGVKEGGGGDMNVSSAEPVFLNVYGAQESIPRNEFRQPMCSLAGRYDNPISTRFLARIDCLKIPAQFSLSKIAY